MSPVIHIFDTPLANEIVVQLAGFLPKNSKLALVADSNTYNALGRSIHEELLEQYQIELRLLPAHVKADKAIAEVLTAQLTGSDALLCVGSGSLNDMCKYIAQQHDIPYLLCPTAASMNGYSSATSSLTIDGYKTSISTKAPDVILVDQGVIANAPHRLTRAGLGDSLCRSVTQCDAYLSYRLLGTRYEAKWFDVQLPYEKKVAQQLDALARGDEQVIVSLFRWLLTSGDAMREAGSSIPASQAEHMVAHANGMLQGDIHEDLHGEEIAVTSVSVSHMYEKLLQKEKITLKAVSKEAAKKQLMQHFSEAQSDAFIEVAMHKGIFDEGRMAELNDVLRHHWLDIRTHLDGLFIGANSLETMLQNVKLKTDVEQTKWNPQRYDDALALAHLTRDRFTILDMIALGSE